MLREKLLNFAIYQTAWILCVLAAGAGRPGLAAVVTLAGVGVHLLLALDPRAELGLVLAAALVGLLVDSAQLALGVFAFPSAAPWGLLPPLWVVAMWMLFAITLRFCLGWLRGRPWLAVLAGLIGGPLAFAAGERLGAVTLLEPRAVSFLVLAGFWAAALSLLVALAGKRREGETGGYRLWTAAAPDAENTA